MGSFSRLSSSFRTCARHTRIPNPGYLIQTLLLSYRATPFTPSGGSTPVLDYLKHFGFSDAQLERIVERAPKILRANLDRTIKPKIQLFLDSGFSPEDTAQILAGGPSVLTGTAVDRISRSIVILKRLMGSDSKVVKALRVSAWFLNHDLDKNFVHNMELMISRGVKQSQIVASICHHPRLLLYAPGAMRELVRRVDETGFDKRSGVFLVAVRVMSSMSIETWESKLELLQSLGISGDDALEMFKRCPQVFTLSERKFKESMIFFLDELKIDMAFMVKNSWLFKLSLEHRVKPRLKVVDVLVSNNLLAKKPSLALIANASQQIFVKKYVLPYYDFVGELYTTATLRR